MRGKPRNITRVVGMVVRIEYVRWRRKIRFGVSNTEKDQWQEMKLREFFDKLGITKRDVLEAFGLWPYVTKEEDADIEKAMKP